MAMLVWEERSEWERLGAWGPGDVAPMAETAKMFSLEWILPAEDFLHSQTQRPRPVQCYGQRVLEAEGLRLRFELSSWEDAEKTSLRLAMSPELGAPKLEWTAFAKRRDESGLTPFTASLRKAIARLDQGIPHPRSLWARRHIWAEEKLRLEIQIRAGPETLTPVALVRGLLADEMAKSGAEWRQGLIGEVLWAQVATSGHSMEEAPVGSDAAFRCSDGVWLYAHRQVLATVCPRLSSTLRKEGHKEFWVLTADHLPSAAVREALHLLYLKRVSPTLHRAPLGAVLEAGRVLNLAPRLNLEVERRLIHLAQGPGNRLQLGALALAYSLPVLSNLISTSADNDPDLHRRLTQLTEQLRQHRHIHPDSALHNLQPSLTSNATH